ncbi:vacuolar transport chaperone-like protein [Monoraphidium neglectum]|uniref:Vacuolar transport chaperone-like protein n=1 Tax=Monoraphidium neglectum TaxID=145388 RepID=A0A0D2JGD5_9CHLO|nr:vacuolar transport chaperone-like protein [Monoraphidium neglectum]KIY98487.1 vacuolar transport chaperone-like protein [Monoraphidium neglectum]|eukprot:XP_013897507.1 vacuolar transport chaperone-like protein [Monoraphidium neglectum]
MDSLFGTRYHTVGAELQLPRKVPMRVEPKSFFANERTFLSWCSMATTMGGVSSAMVGLTFSRSGGTEGRVISARTVDMVSAVYVPLAILMVAYALFMYNSRSSFMRKKQVGFFDDTVGPITLAVITLITLVAITVMAFIDVVL